MGESAHQRVPLLDEDGGVRLDVVLARRLDGMTRARAKAWIAGGRVTVNGRRAIKSHPVAPGDEVLVDQGWRDTHAAPDPSVTFDVLFESDDFVVINKPAGVPTHPLEHDELGTLCNGLVARYPEMRGVGYGPREPGIVHRLDTGTSGVVLAARTAKSFEQLRELLRSGKVQKRYLALCAGRVVGPATIALPIAADPKNKRRVIVCESEREVARLKAQPARSAIVSSQVRGDFTLVELRADSARRHQIRAHLAAIGHPLVGDALYGGPALDGVAHHCLHALSISFTPSGAHDRVTVTAPPPSWCGKTQPAR